VESQACVPRDDKMKESCRVRIVGLPTSKDCVPLD